MNFGAFFDVIGVNLWKTLQKKSKKSVDIHACV